MIHFRPNPVTRLRVSYMHSLGLAAEVLTSVFVLVVLGC